jgi:hypothetical protein
MKVKIGNTIYDSNEEPIMLILSESDKENITNMTTEAVKFCSFPDKYDFDYIKEFMKTE